MEAFLSSRHQRIKQRRQNLSSLSPQNLLEKLKTHYSFYKDPIGFHEQVQKNNKRCSLIPISIGKKRIWLLNDLKAIEEVLVTKSDVFIRNSKLPTIIGEGLLSSNGKSHQKRCI